MRERLQQWIDDKETSSQQRARLRRLDEALAEQAKTDAKVALELVARLPTIAERLIEGKVPEPAKNGRRGR